MSHSTSSLLKLVAKNEIGAVEEFVQAYGSLIWSLARSCTASRGSAENETQEIFSDIWRQAGQFESSGLTEISFIYAVARCRQRRLASRSLVYSLSSAETPTTLTITRPNRAMQ